MKILFSVLMFLGGVANAAEGYMMYETASSSVTYATVTLSSTTVTLISISTASSAAQNVYSGRLSPSWYSITLFNVNASTAVYGFSGSSASGPAPTLTCANGIPLGAGTQLAPWNQTEQFTGFFMWGLSCADNATVPLKVVYRGR